MKTSHLIHLFHRIGFGITPKELESYSKLPKNKIIDTLFLASQSPIPIHLDLGLLNKFNSKDKMSMASDQQKKELKKEGKNKVKELNFLWLQKLATSNQLLLEKMTLFWANHFVCEQKNNPIAQLQYNNMLRRNALGNFRTFLKEMSREPSMIKYLNTQQNKKGKINENFGRELLELFTLGQGNYTEQDIKEAARAFTGWGSNPVRGFRVTKKQHDDGQKTFFGKTGNWGGDDIIDIVLEQRQCAVFICEKIYKYFVNPTVDKKHVEKMTDIFYQDYDIRNLMKFVLNSNWFYEDKNMRTKIKSPIELLTGIYKIVPYKFKDYKNSKNTFNKVLFLQRRLGQILLYPPNVAGWPGNKHWIDANTIMLRLKLPSILLANSMVHLSSEDEFEDDFETFSKKRKNKKRSLQTSVRWNQFQENFKDAELLKEVLIGTELSSETRQHLQSLPNQDLQKLCIQLMSLPEYQLC